MIKKNNFKTEQEYLDIFNGIKDNVLNFYNISNRNDLIMLYEMSEEKIYSYIYSEFIITLNLRSQNILKKQFEDAQKANRIVLFIRDDENKVLKSYTF